MATLNAQQIADLVISSRLDPQAGRLSQIAQKLTHYEVMPKWFKKDRVVFGSGHGIQHSLFHQTLGTFKQVGLLGSDNVNVGEHLKQITIYWTHAQTHWGFDVRQLMMNRGAQKVNDLLNVQRCAGLIDMAEGLETKAWSAGTAGDDLDPWGVPHWVVKNNTVGFNGGYPAGFTSLAGIDLNEVTTYKNYTGQYTNITKADLIKKWRTMFRKTKFRSPVTIREFRENEDRRYYMNESTLSDIEDVGEQQNENLGRDVASMDGVTVFRRIPLIWIPELDADTTDPIYQLDMGTFRVAILKGDYMRESEPLVVPGQHNARQIFVDMSYNYFCVNRRCNGVLAKNVTMP